MNSNDYIAIGTVLTGLLAAVGTGVNWLIGTIDKKNTDLALATTLAREALSNRVQEEIALLRTDISRLQAEKGLYLRRIYQLEAFIHRNPGMEIPAMAGWPPV